jgi:hypothetical protein
VQVFVIDTRKADLATKPRGSSDRAPLAPGWTERIDRDAQRHTFRARCACRSKVHGPKAAEAARKQLLELLRCYVYLDDNLELRLPTLKVRALAFWFDELLEQTRHGAIMSRMPFEHQQVARAALPLISVASLCTATSFRRVARLAACPLWFVVFVPLGDAFALG